MRLPPRRRIHVAAWGVALLAAMPYWLPYAVHYSRTHAVPTGFLWYDMPYYAANGRAVFERGNGLSGPNPYDYNPDASPIYFHWFTWLLGFGITQLGLEPGALFVAIGVAAGLVCSRLTLRLVETVLPAPGARGLLFLLTMWGGGLLVPGRIAVNFVAGDSPWYWLLRFDPFGGKWCLYWGRTLIYPTEAVYHVLVCAAWLAVLADWPVQAALWATILAATHPFSGAQLLATLGVWWLVRLANGQRAQGWQWEGLLLTGVAGAFLAYNFLFLESFASHRVLRQHWSLNWNPGLLSQALAYGPVLLLAAWRLWACWRSGGRLPRQEGFLLVAAVVGVILSNHHRLMSPRQPLHFTRGYVWLPLLLLGLPLVQRWWFAAQARLGIMAGPVFVLLLPLVAFDNIFFLAHTIAEPRQNEFYLTPAEQDVLRWLRGHREQGVLLCRDTNLSYLAATYTSARPYIGHGHMTPDRPQRVENMVSWFEHGCAGPWLADIDLVLVERDRFAAQDSNMALESPEWEIVYENVDFVLLRHVQR